MFKIIFKLIKKINTDEIHMLEKNPSCIVEASLCLCELDIKNIIYKKKTF